MDGVSLDIKYNGMICVIHMWVPLGFAAVMADWSAARQSGVEMRLSLCGIVMPGVQTHIQPAAGQNEQ